MRKKEQVEGVDGEKERGVNVGKERRQRWEENRVGREEYGGREGKRNRREISQKKYR
jgi:hypothetical protein